MWNGIETLNILTETVLALLPIYILWDLHLAWTKKSLVMAAFALRLLYDQLSSEEARADFEDRDVPLFALRIFYTDQALRTTDRTYTEFKSVVTTEVALNVSIILACVPFLKLLLDNLQSGWSTSNVQTGAGFRNSSWLSGGKISTPLDPSRGQSGGRSQKSGISLEQFPAPISLGSSREISRDGSDVTEVA